MARVILTAVVGLSVITAPLAVAPSASAHDDGPRQPISKADLATRSAPSSAALGRPASASPTGSKANAAPNSVPTQPITGPSDCWGNSNNPHNSTSVRGAVKGYSETYCKNGNPPWIWVDASVWASRWWGYQDMGSHGTGSETYASSIGRSGIFNGCEINGWRTVGEHQVVDADQQVYTTETMRYADVTYC